jgi:hypothetical protein
MQGQFPERFNIVGVEQLGIDSDNTSNFSVETLNIHNRLHPVHDGFILPWRHLLVCTIFGLACSLTDGTCTTDEVCLEHQLASRWIDDIREETEPVEVITRSGDSHRTNTSVTGNRQDGVDVDPLVHPSCFFQDDQIGLETTNLW